MQGISEMVTNDLMYHFKKNCIFGKPPNIGLHSLDGNGFQE
jgi:hypothetical protein